MGLISGDVAVATIDFLLILIASIAIKFALQLRNAEPSSVEPTPLPAE